ncbi:bifunctional nuclease domain-containing protein, partial [uncultured Desulfovibrio sp.]
MVEMRVFGLTIDPQTKNPMVILKETDGEVVLPIWLGAMEAMAISLVLNNERLPRPLTHDLLLMSLNALRAALLHVE